MSDLTAIERAIVLRAHVCSPGYLMEAEALDKKLELVKEQGYLLPEERHPDYKSWSIDRISGMVLGLGYARKFLQIWLAQYDAAERTTAEAQFEDEGGVGHPYAPESNESTRT